MQKSLVTVVIPTYNRATVIKNSINSVLTQTYQNFEIIVADDGSNDNTEEVVKSFNNPKIKYFYQNNLGVSAARNKGLKEAKGEFIVFLDCADEFLPEFIEKFLQQFQNPDIGCVYCFTGIDGNNNDIIPARIDTLSGSIYKEALIQGYITSPLSIMMRKSCFDKTGGWDENLKSSEDDDMCFRLAKYFNFVLIPEVLNYVNVTQGTGISANRKTTADGWWDLWQKYKDEVIENCGVDVLIKHYLECFELQKGINDLKKQREILISILKLKFKLKYLLMYFETFFQNIYRKEKTGNKRKLIFFNLIKISYKK